MKVVFTQCGRMRREEVCGRKGFHGGPPLCTIVKNKILYFLDIAEVHDHGILKMGINSRKVQRQEWISFRSHYECIGRLGRLVQVLGRCSSAELNQASSIASGSNACTLAP